MSPSMSTCETHLVTWWIIIPIRRMNVLMTAPALVKDRRLIVILCTECFLVLPSSVPPCGCVLQPSASHLLAINICGVLGYLSRDRNTICYIGSEDHRILRLYLTE